MCLSLTPTGVCHAIDVTLCPDLPPDQPYLLRPLPGAPQYRCPHPCGNGTCRFVSALPAPPPVPAVLRQSLRLAPTLAGLIAGALAAREPLGTLADTQGPPAWGSLRYYRN